MTFISEGVVEEGSVGIRSQLDYKGKKFEELREIFSKNNALFQTNKTEKDRTIWLGTCATS